MGNNEKEYREVQHLDFPIQAIKTLNPATSQDRDTYYISRLIYDGLFELDDKLVPKNNLASSYVFDKKSDSVLISLVSAKFHDGKSFTADDVKFSVYAYKTAGEKCLYSSLVQNISYVKKEGSDKVRIYFKDSKHMALDCLTFPILPKHRYNGIYDIINRTGNFTPIGTGRYKFKSYINNKAVEVDKNEQYHGVAPNNSITFSVVKNPDTAYKLVEASSLSGIFTRDLNREKKITNKKQTVVEFPANEAEIIGFNMSKEATSSKYARRAVAYAIDNSKIIHDAYDNGGMYNDSLYYPGYLGVKNDKSKYKRSLRKAVKSLKKAGYEDKNGDGVAENEAGASLSLNILVNSDKKHKIEEAEIIKSDLSQMGASVNITSVPEKAYKKYLLKGNFDIFLGTLKYDGMVDLRDLLQFDKPPEVTVDNRYSNKNNENDGEKGKSYSSKNRKSYDKNDSGDQDSEKEKQKLFEKRRRQKELKLLGKMKVYNMNYARYYNGKLENLLDRMKSGITIEEMKETLSDIKDVLNDEMPYYCVLQRTYCAIQSTSLNGDLKPMFDNYFPGIENLNSKYEVQKEKKEKEKIPGNM